MLPWKALRAEPSAYSSARLTRIITGLPNFLDMNAGMTMDGYAVPLEPKPPPQYSAISTTSSGFSPSICASVGSANDWLCSDACTKHLPFCQYDMQVRGSM